MKRPAETAGAAGAGLPALALALGLSDGIIAATGILAGLVPAAVTFLVANGGVKGLAGKLWGGE